MNPLSDYIKTVSPFIPAILVSQKYLKQTEKISELFPAPITELFGFECKLDTDNITSDFAFSIKNNNAKKFFSHINFPEDKEWRKVNSFFKSWLEEKYSLNKIIDSVCLEFDIEERMKKLPPPGFFISFNDYLKKKPSPEKTIEDYITTAEKTLTLLKGKSFFEKIKPLYTKALRILPRKAGIFQIGLMMSRSLEAIRICLTGFNIDETIIFLKNMNWPGSTEKIRKILEKSLPMAHRFDIAIDIGETIYPKVGLEISFKEKYINKGSPKWIKFLNYLREEKLCTEKKAEALLKYPAYILDDPYILLFTDLWPENLRNDPLKRKSIFIKKLNHFKIVYEEKKPLTVKAYLAVHQTWKKKDRGDILPVPQGRRLS